MTSRSRHPEPVEGARLRATPFLLLLLLPASLFAQTPPIKPTTPDVPVFPGLIIPQIPSTIGNEPLTADEAVAIAQRMRPALRAAFEDVKAARGRRDAARAEFLPQFTLTYSGSQVRVLKGQQFAGSQGVGFRSQSGLSVSQLLYDFGRTRAFVRQQRALATAAEHGFATALLDAEFTTRQAFYALQRASEQEQAANGNLENRNAQLALANARLESGLGAPADLVRAKNSVAEATIALTSARTATIAAKISFCRLLGVDPRTPITLAPSQERQTEGDVTSLAITAIESRPEIRQADANIRALSGGLDFARRSNAPTLTFSANISTRGETDPLTNQTSSVGIGFSWLIGDGGAGAGRTREAKANLAAAKADLEGLVQQIVGEVVQASVEVTAAEQRLTASLVQLQNAKELVRISEGRYKGGIGTFLEVVDAQDALFAAERNVSAATADLHTARASLRRAVGRSE